MRTKNSKAISVAESAHMARVKESPCAVCDAPPPSSAHHIRQATYERQKAAGKFRDYNSRRRGFERRSLPKGWIPMLEKRQRMKCASCRACLKGGYHLDHIVPISKCGPHEAGNVQLLCAPCNLRKSNHMPEVWARMNGRLI